MNKIKRAGLATVLSVMGALTTSLLVSIATSPLSASAAETLTWSSNAAPPSMLEKSRRPVTATSGGAVTLSILPGQPAYPGSNVNGVSTQDHQNGSGSFMFFDTQEFAQTVADDIAVARAEEGKPMKIYWRFDVEDNLDRTHIGETFTYRCMPDNLVSANVWGTDVYEEDSSVCYAAVHSGLITIEEGGEVTVKIGSGQASYSGSSRNGVSSRDITSRTPHQEISFTFVK